MLTCLNEQSPLADCKGGICPNAKHVWLLISKDILVRLLQCSSVNPLLPSQAYILSLILTDNASIRLLSGAGGILRSTSHTD